jgi:hypothetical protein
LEAPSLGRAPRLARWEGDLDELVGAPVAARTNGAALMWNLFERIEELCPRADAPEAFGTDWQEWDDAARAAVAAYVAPTDEVPVLLEEALARPRLVFVPERTEDLFVPDAPSPIRGLQRLNILLAARVHLGDDAEATRLTALRLRLTEVWEPTSVMEAVVVVALRAHAVDGLLDEVEAGRFDGDHLASLSSLAVRELDDVYERGVAADAVSVAHIWRWMRGDFESQVYETALGEVDVLKSYAQLRAHIAGKPWMRWTLGGDYATAIAKLHESVRAEGESRQEWLKRLQRMASADRGSYTYRNHTYVRSVALPLVAERFVRLAAHQRLARIALASRLYRDATGAWPATLDELADQFPGGVPLSPFADRPYDLSIEGDALRIACPTEPEGGPVDDDVWEGHYDTPEKLRDLGLSRLLLPPPR